MPKAGFHWRPEKIQDPRKRFWSKVVKTPTCWEWRGAGYPTYGRFRPTSMGAMINAHHYSWIEAGNAIPEGMFLLHSCDNRPCVRPSHLRVGTQRDNIHDALLRGRRIGPQKRKVKLTPDDVRAIRARLARGEKAKTIAPDYGVTTRPIWYIARNEKWAWLH